MPCTVVQGMYLDGPIEDHVACWKRDDPPLWTGDHSSPHATCARPLLLCDTARDIQVEEIRALQKQVVMIGLEREREETIEQELIALLGVSI